MREIVKTKHVMLEFNGRDILNISELCGAFFFYGFNHK